MANVITNKNFPSIMGGDDRPLYKVALFEASTSEGLEVLINNALKAMEDHPADSVALLDIGYSSTGGNGTNISYSAAVTYVYFGMPD